MLEDYLLEEERPWGYFTRCYTKLDLYKGCGPNTVDDIRCELARVKRLANIAEQKPTGILNEEETAPKPIHEMSVDALDISTRARNVLRSAKISTVGDLEKQLVEIGRSHRVGLRIYGGCGLKTAGIILQGLAELRRSKDIH
jgi:hypothetical protein